MPNSDTSAAHSFHNSTKLSYISLATKPPLYKSYPGLATVALPSEMPSPEAPTLPAVGGTVSQSQGTLDLSAVAQLMHYSAGLIRRSTCARPARSTTAPPLPPGRCTLSSST